MLSPVVKPNKLFPSDILLCLFFWLDRLSLLRLLFMSLSARLYVFQDSFFSFGSVSAFVGYMRTDTHAQSSDGFKAVPRGRVGLEQEPQ